MSVFIFSSEYNVPIVNHFAATASVMLYVLYIHTGYRLAVIDSRHIDYVYIYTYVCAHILIYIYKYNICVCTYVCTYVYIERIYRTYDDVCIYTYVRV